MFVHAPHQWARNRGKRLQQPKKTYKKTKISPVGVVAEIWVPDIWMVFSQALNEPFAPICTECPFYLCLSLLDMIDYSQLSYVDNIAAWILVPMTSTTKFDFITWGPRFFPSPQAALTFRSAPLPPQPWTKKNAPTWR